MHMYTYRLIHNGREIDNVRGSFHHTEQAAIDAGTVALDDHCPPQSPSRAAYRVESKLVTFKMVPGRGVVSDE